MNTPLDIRTICKLYEVDDYLRNVEEENPGNSRPYHNLKHILAMTRISHEIMVVEILNGNQDVKWNDIRIMLISCLFHDWGHHSKNDAENIETAVRGFLAVSNETEEVNLAVVDNIRATQYPYVIPEEDLHLIQKVMRDADTLQWSEGEVVEHVIKGIAAELEIDIPRMLEGQRKFMTSLSFRTLMGRAIAAERMPIALEQVSQFERDYF